MIYAITSLAPDKLMSEALLQIARAHWNIENGLFHVRDVASKDDASRVRTGAAKKVMAELRNASLTLIRQDGHKPHPARPRSAVKRVMSS